MIFLGMKMFLPVLKWETFIVFSNPYLVTYHWNVIHTRKIMKLRKGFYDIPVQNGGLSKFTSCQTVILYGVQVNAVNCTIVFITLPFKTKCLLKWANEKKCKAPSKICS